MISKRNQIKKEFKKGITSIFRNLLKYAFFSGRFAYNADKIDKSDIDVIVVLKNAFSESLDSRIAQELIKKAVSKYLEIHIKYGYKPDMLFPGEYVTSNQIEDSLNGRGYYTRNDSIYLPIVHSEDYWDCHENEYRAWRSMSAFNNAALIAGDIESFQRNRNRAWEEIIKFLSLNEQVVSAKKILELIVNGGEGYLGICSDYEPKFSEQELGIVKKSLRHLSSLNFLTSISEESYKVNRDKLNDWQKSIVNKLRKNNWKGRGIVNWNDIRRYAKNKIIEFYENSR